MLISLSVVVTAFAVAYIFMSWQLALLFGAAVGIAFNWNWFYVAIRTAPRDIRALICYAKILWLTRYFNKKNLSMPDIFHETVIQFPDKNCFLFEDKIWTFKQVEDFSLRVSALLKSEGICRGKTVGLFMSNCPQYPGFWLGIARLGAVTPLINTNQRGNALLHSINVANCDAIIFGDEMSTAIQDILLNSQLCPSIKLYKYSWGTKDAFGASTSHDDNEMIKDLNVMLDNTQTPSWSLSEGDGFHGRILYIYTSGTTGLPKAAVISTSRIVFMASAIHNFLNIQPADVIYCPLPLYHTAGGVISLGQAIIYGSSVVMKTKFSASQYFPDCSKYNATIGHYIGEMCRYIMATPQSPSDKQHHVRAVFGNGMRPQIWTEFVKRFNIRTVGEFYGATEGNANIMNVDGTVGAIGFVSRIIPKVYPIAIIKVDQETGEPIRDSRGLCQLAQPDEPGVFIGKISPNNPSRAYLGYVDKKASEKKIVHNVFEYGDSAFISGDILVSDELGYLYFKDRTGDTFRWRGENVSTTEVEAAVSRVANNRDAVVYGVMIPNTEGRAGMCGIVDEDGTLDLDKLAKDLANDLPPYARPIFVRVMVSVEMTGTFKMKKNDLQKEGYNPTIIKDKLYYLDAKTGKYSPLGPEEYNKINNGSIRL